MGEYFFFDQQGFGFLQVKWLIFIFHFYSTYLAFAWITVPNMVHVYSTQYYYISNYHLLALILLAVLSSITE